MKDCANDWCFSGEVLTFRELPENREFGGAMTLLGQSQRGRFPVKSCSLGIMIPRGIWNKMNEKRIGIGSYIEVAGHFETWLKTTVSGNEKNKTQHVCDQLIG